MAPPLQLVRLSVLDKTPQKNVTGGKNWVAVKKGGQASIIIEATTTPKNSTEEWKQIKWSGDGEAMPGQPHRRKLSLAVSKKYHVEAKLGGGSDYVDLWVLWASIEILTKGTRPANASPFDPGTRDNTNQLGAVTYQSLTSSVIDEKAGVFVNNMGASGKVAPVATLTPKGIRNVLKGGLTFEREAWSRNWSDGKKGNGFNTAWTRDTSNAAYLRLFPDAEDKIYDLDGPDIRWGQQSYETYNNFRQWITWNNEKCSDYALWYWQARWSLNRDMGKQITLNQVGTGNIELPDKPFTPAVK